MSALQRWASLPVRRRALPRVDPTLALSADYFARRFARDLSEARRFIAGRRFAQERVRASATIARSLQRRVDSMPAVECGRRGLAGGIEGWYRGLVSRAGIEGLVPR